MPVITRLVTAVVATSCLMGIPQGATADSQRSASAAFKECRGSGDVIEVRGGVTCKQAKKVVTGIYYDGRGTQVNDHRTDYLGFKCNWPNEDGYSMSCQSKKAPERRINFFSD